MHRRRIQLPRLHQPLDLPSRHRPFPRTILREKPFFHAIPYFAGVTQVKQKPPATLRPRNRNRIAPPLIVRIQDHIYLEACHRPRS